MKSPEASSDSPEMRELKLLPLRVAKRQHELGLIGDAELAVIAAVTAESFGNKVIPRKSDA